MNFNQRTFIALSARSFTAEQSEGDALTYSIDYTAVLQTDTISTSTWEAAGVTVASAAKTTKAVSARLSASPGCYEVINKIVTANSGDTYQRTIKLTVTGDSLSGDYE